MWYPKGYGNNQGWYAPVAAAGGAAVTFDPNHKGSAQTLSGDKLTVTGTGTNGIVIATVGASTGKFYWEYPGHTTNSFGDCLGLVQLAQAGDGQPDTGVRWRVNGQIFVNGSLSTTVDGFIQNNSFTSAIAVDLGARLAWFRAHTNSWNANGSADPDTGVGGIDISAATGTLYAMAQTGNTDVATVNFGATTYNLTKPSTFGNWV